jgi:hypothetical protein
MDGLDLGFSKIWTGLDCPRQLGSVEVKTWLIVLLLVLSYMCLREAQLLK